MPSSASSFNTWLERVFLAPWNHWDTKYYVWITQRGYRLDDGTAQFHPLLAWLAMPLGWLTGHPLAGLLLVSSLASLLLLIFFERLARLDLPPAVARTSTLLLVFAPPSFILWAPYTEGLFLLWGVLCLLWARQGAWWKAGLAGGLATLTRQQGVLLALPLAWELWEAAGRSPRSAFQHWRAWLSLTLIPGSLVIWIVFRAIVLADVHPDWSDPQALIYSVLVSPSAEKVVPTQALLPPWQALELALVRFRQAPEITLTIDLTLGAGFVVLLAISWPHLRASFRLYVVAITLLSFAYHTGPVYPYMGLPRHLLLAFPVFIGLGPALSGRWTRPFVLASGMLGLLFLTTLFANEFWVP